MEGLYKPGGNNTHTTFEMVAKTLFGLEEVLATELMRIGAMVTQVGNRAVTFSGDQRVMYRANYELRTALRILVPIRRFTARTPNTLYKRVQQVNWSKLMRVTDTFAINSVANSEYFQHSHYASLKVKDAIADQFRRLQGDRPSVDLDAPDLRIHIHIYDDQCTLLLDSSGESLHKRGYRVKQHAAPLNEVLAAGLLLLADYKGERPFLDPFCGSGTLPIEAAFIATNTPPQKLRNRFGFQQWGEYNETIFEQVKERALEQIRPAPAPIVGCDISKRNLDMAADHLLMVDLSDQVQLEVRALQEMPVQAEGSLLVMNPPYGERLHPEDIKALYKDIGDAMKQKCLDSKGWIICTNRTAMNSVGLRPFKKHVIYNGPLEGRYHGYEMYSGSRKKKRE